MKVQKSPSKPEPHYPSRRQLAECTTLLGVAAIGLGSLAGLAAPPSVPVENAPKEAEAPPIALGGVMVVEPPPPRVPGGIRPEAPPRDTNTAARTTYVVQKGDTLSSIAKTRLGGGERACEITKLNPGIKPDELKPGQLLVLPAPVRTNSVPHVEGDTPPPPPRLRGEMPVSPESKGAKP